MAKLDDATVRVAVESLAHDALSQLIQRIEAEHGLIVNKLSVEWLDTSTMDRPSAKVVSLTIETHRLVGVGR